MAKVDTIEIKGVQVKVGDTVGVWNRWWGIPTIRKVTAIKTDKWLVLDDGMEVKRSRAKRTFGYPWKSGGSELVLDPKTTTEDVKKAEDAWYHSERYLSM